MARTTQTVALLCANPALSSILCATLASNPRLRVRSFETSIALAFYVGIAPVDILVADLDDGSFDCEIVEASAIGPKVMVVGLTRTVVATEGVDEIIAKPMSPRYVLERVLARLGRTRRPLRLPIGGNVVPLFRPRGVPAN